MVNIAVIGIGKWGKKLLSEFSKKSNVVWVCSNGKRENIDWLLNRFPDINHTTDIEDILKDPSINLVIVATPIESHFSITKKFLESGKNVFCEKPVATNSKETEALERLSYERNCVLFTGFTFLYSDIFIKLKDIAATEKIISININWNKMGSFSESIYWNLLTHPISIIYSLIGEIVIDTFSEKTNIVSENDILFMKPIANNVPCQVHINRFSQITSFQLILKTEKNIFVWSDSLLYKYIEGKLVKILDSSNSPLSNECQYVLNLIEKGKGESNLDISLAVTRIIEKVIK